MPTLCKNFVVGPVKVDGEWYGPKIEATKEETININFAGVSWFVTPMLDQVVHLDRQIVSL